MNEIINFLKNRRSVTAKKMKDGHVSDEHLNEIIESEYFFIAYLWGNIVYLWESVGKYPIDIL